MCYNILIIDDEKKLCGLLARIISLEGFNVFEANTGKEGLNLIKSHDMHVVISDVKLPDYSGIELVKEIKRISPYTEIINLTAYGTIADGVTAIKNGAFDYITKGDDNEKIIPLVYKAIEKAKLSYRVFELENKINKKYGFDAIIGTSKAITASINLAKKVAPTDTTVLLLGETGTGKEIFAQAIHYSSLRNSKPFIAVNCSGFNPELMESELFGYLAGAFTGALKDKKGLIEEADGGTIFLDEIGELNLDLQAKLLRVLDNQTFLKVGATQTSKVNVRILAATNRDLKKETEKGSFRLDLYYRLSVFAIELPSLALRKEDIKPIALHYLNEFSAKVNKPKFVIDKEFMDLITHHHWKGNIRELKNIMERVVILAEDNTINGGLLPLEFHHEQHAYDPFNMQALEKQHIYKVLNYAKGNKAETARLLGIGLTTLYRKLEDYQIQ